MKICMVLHDPQEFGGLEEYAVTLAIGLKERGQQISVLSTTWVSPDNQYIRRLRDKDVTYTQVPKLFSRPSSHWPTKEKILAALMWLATPVVYIFAVALTLLRRCSWRQSLTSARGWVHGQLLTRLIGPDRYKPLSRLLLNWWQLRWKPDILHVQGYTSSLLFVIDWAFSKNIPVVYEEHQTPDAQFDWWQGFKQSINRANVVVAVSAKSAQALRDVCDVTKPIVVRNPLLPDPLDSGLHLKGEKGHNVHAICVTTVARLSIAKGIPYLLDAIAIVRETHPTTQFRVYGDGPMRKELLDQAHRLGLDGDDIFVGAFTQREELSDIMARTDIFVMSSILEGQPLGVVEAMAYGCPIVTTAVGGIPELIEDGVNGLLCSPGSPECLADKINVLIENPHLRSRLGKAARITYEYGPYQPDAVCDFFISLYQDQTVP